MTVSEPPEAHLYPKGARIATGAVKALLRHAGIHELDVPAPDGAPRIVTMEQAEAAITRRGLTVTVPDALPPPDVTVAGSITAALLRLGTHLMRLRNGEKTPVENGWPGAPALSETEAAGWLASGGNLGINVGASQMIILDAENGAATAALREMGFTPDAVTANAQDQTNKKFGGTHVYLRVPASLAVPLQSVLSIVLPGGGTMDFLAGGSDGANARFAVAPGSRLDEAPGYAYGFAAGGAALSGAVPEAPDWLFDPALPAPTPAAEELRAAVLRGVLPRTKRMRTAATDALTEAVDELDWATWLDDDPRVQIIGTDGKCGCDVFHWSGASTDRSGILHDGCEVGYGVHVFSGTLIGKWDRDHGSRLQFGAWLRGISEADTAREMGIPMGGGQLAPIYPPGDDPDDAPTAPETTTPRVVGGPSPRPQLIPTAETARSNVIPLRPTIYSIDGSVALAAEPAPEEAPTMGGPTVPASTTPTFPEPGDDTGMRMFNRIAEVETETGFWNSLPILQRIAEAADSHGLGRWGLLGACLPRIALNIPPYVRLVGASGVPGGPNSGTSLNLMSLITGPAESGKSETIKTAQDLVPVPEQTKRVVAGTAEGIIKTFGYMKKTKPDGADANSPEPGVFTPDGDGYEYIRITDTVMLEDGEISALASEMDRLGSKATGALRSMWTGESVGTTAGEIDRRTFLEPHSYRLGVVLGSQIDATTLGRIFTEGRRGTPQRFGLFPAMLVPRRGEPVEHLTTGTVYWLGGPRMLPTSPNQGEVFITRPPAADTAFAIDRERRQGDTHLAYSTTEAVRREEEDPDADRRGHELLHQLKVAAVLAAGDGHRNPEDVHWHVAGLVLAVRDVVHDACSAVVRAQEEVADTRRGKTAGRQRAAAKKAERVAELDAAEALAERVRAVVGELGGVASEAGIARKLSKGQAADLPKLLLQMAAGGSLLTAGANGHGHQLYRLP